MIHGLMGCTMRKTGALAFIPVRAALGLPTPSLALPIKWEADVQASDGAVIGEPLTQIGCCGCVLHDQYGEFMEAFAKRRQDHFSYDWRRELGESAKRLEEHLEAMVKKYDAPVQCVAHSMGCMRLLAVMHRRPELIHSAIFAGGTFAGGIGYHFLLARGERIGLNGTLVAPEAVATWPCAYATASPVGDPLLIGDDGTPHWQVLDKAKLKKGEAASIEIDWYDIETWERLGLGVFGHGEKPSDEMRAHVATALRLGKQFQREMRAVRNDPRDYPPCATLIGHGYQGEDFFLWDADARTMKEVWRGDGLYVHKSSGPPPLEGAPPPCETDGLLPYFCSTLPPGVPHSMAKAQSPAQRAGAEVRPHGPDRRGRADRRDPPRAHRRGVAPAQQGDGQVAEHAGSDTTRRSPPWCRSRARAAARVAAAEQHHVAASYRVPPSPAPRATISAIRSTP